MADPREERFDELLRRVARTPDLSGLPRRLLAGTRLAGRFTVEEKLGEGGMGCVFAAFDDLRQTRVALKTLSSQARGSLAQLKREFRVAAELSHPNLVRLHEFFSDGPEWFFTMDLLHGKPLPQLQRTGLATEALRDVFCQLATALHTLHQAEVVHGDLKPSNFLITEAERRVVLLDFGLASPAEDGRRDQHGGTPLYMAPEQLLGAPLTEAADWYSFGVVLFEALARKLPSRGNLESDLAQAPPDLRRLCLQLLSREPAERPHGAHVLASLGVQGTARTLTSVPPGLHFELFGREHELRLLQDAFQRTVRQEPGIVLVHGPSGIGKTALVTEFAGDARARGAVVLRGRCREKESVSYKAIDGLIDDVITLLDGLPRAEVEAILPDGIAELTRIFPALRTVSAIAQAPEPAQEMPDQAVVRRLAIMAFRELLAALGRRGPLVLWVDDLQWSDAESALLLGPLLSRTDPLPLLFVGSYRTQSEEGIPLLGALLAERGALSAEPVVIELGPLSREDAERLALTLLAEGLPDAESRARTIAQDSAGHPLFTAELAYSSRPSSGSAEGVTLAELVSQRVEALPPAARELVRTVAIAGAPLSRPVIRRSLDLGAAAAEEAIDLLRASRLVRSHGLGVNDEIDVHHDRVREIIGASLSELDRAARHHLVARALEAEPATRPELLATHFEAAGVLDKAGRYWIAAAGQAFRSLAFHHAANLYAKGLAQAKLDPAETRALMVRRAEALAYAGRGLESAEAYLAATRSGTRDEALELRRLAAEQLLLSGHLERGLEVIEGVLQSLGVRKTRAGASGLASLLYGRMRVRLRGLRYTPRTEGELNREDLARVDACWTVAVSLGVVDFVRGADFQAEHLLLALRAGESRRLLRALTLEVSYAATPGVGSERRTANLLAAADELARQVDEPAVTGLVRLSRGIAAYLQGRVEVSLSECQEAVQIFTRRCSGAIWETVTAQRFIIASLFLLGRLRALSEFVPPLIEEAETQGNLYGSSFFRTTYSNLAWLVKDDLDEARRQLERAREDWRAPGFQLPHCWLLVGDVYAAIYAGEAELGWQAVCKAWPKIEESQILLIGVLRVQLQHLRAVAALNTALARSAQGDAHRASELLREARAATIKLSKERIAMATPLSALVSAGIELAERRRGRARAELERAVRAFDGQGFALYSAAARIRLGQLEGGAEGAALAAAGRSALVAESVQNPERMTHLLAGFPAPPGAR